MIIGVGGEKQHGKDTLANYLVTSYGYQKKAFADNLREICAYAFTGIPRLNFWDEEIKELPFPAPVLASYEQIHRIIHWAMTRNDYRISFQQAQILTIIHLNKIKFTSIRDILQFVGTDLLRNVVHPDYHYAHVRDRIKFANLNKVVVSDCRFPNERTKIREDFNAKTILVERPSMKRNTSSTHASENSLGTKEEYDYLIINDGGLSDLYSEVDKIMESLGVKKNLGEDE